ncbi:restriction endonuclease subunit S [Paracoccus thiocyanatus]|uniref:Restriction endonuclease subunit S n=1 Tax=Paracoccus thiocyanatus TaxID=34006 RepID=A0A3D8PCI2_9RHOB|nr:restriction endonuclease subunit S [Paracoccus thiocyanatus]RDW13786.1 restriction endonuclease subunit S [Paracoccus thiocyanatus]
MNMVPLGNVVEIKGGGTPDKSVTDYWGGNIPWASVKDFKDIALSNTIDRITESGVAASATQVIPAGNIIVPTRMAVGKAAINTIDLAINQDLKALIPSDSLDPRYLLHVLLANARKLEDQATGATVKGIKLDALRNLRIPLPPLPEQKRIAGILDQADALRRLRARALEKLNTLGQAIFQEMFGDGQRLESRKTVSLAEIVKEGTIVTYGIVQAGDEYEDGVPYIRTGDISDGVINQDSLRHTDPTIAAKFNRSKVDAGDIVMSIRATVGTTAIVPPSLAGANLTQGTARISPGPLTNTEFLNSYLQTARMQSWIQRQVKGATFREITLARLRELPVHLPPITMQSEFQNRMSEIRQNVLLLEKGNYVTSSLFASLQHRAFRGEL